MGTPLGALLTLYLEDLIIYLSGFNRLGGAGALRTVMASTQKVCGAESDPLGPMCQGLSQL